MGGVIATVALSVGAVLLVRAADKNAAPDMTIPMPQMPRPILDEH
jgi:hypothetical protein